MATKNSLAFDLWMRSNFIEINTNLEKLYAEQTDRADVMNVGTELKQQLQVEGEGLISHLLQEGNTDEGFDPAFDLLGNVGLFMAACRRHEITNPDRDSTSPLREASALALHIAASIGVTPRFATAHLCTHNKAVDGRYKSFTSLKDELLFIDYNTRGIFGYKRAGDALLKIHELGISHPVANDLFVVAKQAVQDVIDSNEILFATLDTNEFFYAVRPYYKTHHVGSQTYRGANAGDFAAINVIDMLLGLCFANEPSYSRMLVDKFLYMMPEDQKVLRNCMRKVSLMDLFLEGQSHYKSPWFQKNLGVFIELCELHGEAAAQHHNQLVEKYIVKPSVSMDQKHLKQITASGPPLPVLIKALKDLCDCRMATKREDIRTRYKDMKKLKSLL